MSIKTKITVVGSGYVGMSLSVLLAQHNDVTVLDIDQDRVSKVNSRHSTVADSEIQLFLAEKSLSLTATLDKEEAYQGASFIIVATPTNYDSIKNSFDTGAVDRVVEDALLFNQNALVVIKSTIPVGHTKDLQDKFSTGRVIYSPEFLREGQALNDNLYPSRIIVGSECEAGTKFANLLQQAAQKKDIKTLFMQSTEAEAIKLFSNTYLAMRVSFFNELDSYALARDLNAESVISGVCLDDRIGDGYNNPSFGYGGYCLPKDTKQLLANYNDVPQALIESIVTSNTIRKDYIADEILKKNPKIVGLYRLTMKEGSDNFRSSAIQGVMTRLQEKGVEIIIYEPLINETSFGGVKVMSSFLEFKEKSDIVVTNRQSVELNDIALKVFSRDIFNNN